MSIFVSFFKVSETSEGLLSLSKCSRADNLSHVKFQFPHCCIHMVSSCKLRVFKLLISIFISSLVKV